jgi:hypothetical protein
MLAKHALSQLSYSPMYDDVTALRMADASPTPNPVVIASGPGHKHAVTCDRLATNDRCHSYLVHHR